MTEQHATADLEKYLNWRFRKVLCLVTSVVAKHGPELFDIRNLSIKDWEVLRSVLWLVFFYLFLFIRG